MGFENPSAAHVVIRASETQPGVGFLEKLRGVFCKLTTSCLPLHPNSSGSLSHSIHAPSSAPPDLRPPHVLAQANAVSRGVNASTPITLPITSTVASHSPPTTTQPQLVTQTSDCSMHSLRTPTTPNTDQEVINNNSITNNNTLMPSTNNINLISPTHSITNITANPLDNGDLSTKRNTSNQSFATINRTTTKRRAPDPTKMHAPLPPTEKVTSPVQPKQSSYNSSEVKRTTPSNYKEENLNLLNINDIVPTGNEEILDNSSPRSQNTFDKTKEEVREESPIVDSSTGEEVSVVSSNTS